MKYCINSSRRSTKATWTSQTFHHRRHQRQALVDSFIALVYTPDASVTGEVNVWRAALGNLRAVYPTP
jgi:hypothetical protein